MIYLFVFFWTKIKIQKVSYITVKFGVRTNKNLILCHNRETFPYSNSSESWHNLQNCEGEGEGGYNAFDNLNFFHKNFELK